MCNLVTMQGEVREGEGGEGGGEGREGGPGEGRGEMEEREGGGEGREGKRGEGGGKEGGREGSLGSKMLIEWVWRASPVRVMDPPLVVLSLYS